MTPSVPARYRSMAFESTITPVYALGGLHPDDLPRARAAGAHGIAAIRGLWADARSGG